MSIKGAHSQHPYKTARNRALQVWFEAPLEEAEKFFGLPGTRRALVAYWFDALVDLQERDANSTYAKTHHYNAVAALVARPSHGRSTRSALHLEEAEAKRLRTPNRCYGNLEFGPQRHLSLSKDQICHPAALVLAGATAC